MTKKLKSEAPTFEEGLKRLEVIVSRLEKSDITLQDSLVSFEEGMSLAKFLEADLNEATAKVELIIKKNSGEADLVPFTDKANDL